MSYTEEMPMGMEYVPIRELLRGYHDPHYEERLKISGLKDRMEQLRWAASWVKKPHTRDVIFNALAACDATILSIFLSR